MRELLLDAAKSLLWEGGYERMSPRKVLDRSGVGQGSLYHHFPSKRALAAAALVDVERELAAAAKAIFATEAPPLERVQAWLALERNGLAGCRLGRLANEAEILESEDLRGPMADYFGMILGLVTTALVQAAKRGELSDSASAPDIAATIVATVQGGYILSRALADPDAISRATRGAIALLNALTASGTQNCKRE